MKYIANLSEIIATVADECGIPVGVILSPAVRTAPVVHARHVAIYLACKMTWMSRRDIAASFNQHDHTSLLYGFNKISVAITKNAEIKKQVEALAKKLQPKS